MSKGEELLTTRPESGTPYTLNPDQTLRAATALLKAIERSQKEIDTKKPKLLEADEEHADEAQTPVWLVMTAKKHIVDKSRLKPGKITVPHPLWTSNETRICLITADPPADNKDAYKDLVKNVAFPEDLKPRIAKVMAFSKLKTKYKPYESRRQLLSEYDLFLGDERIVGLLPNALGKVFYKNTTKRPVPVCLTGKENYHGKGREGEAGKLKRKREKDTGGPSTVGRPADVGEDIQKALRTTLVHLAPSVTTAVRVAWGAWPAERIVENTTAVVEGLAAKYIPKGWRGIKSIHIKGPDTLALPIWLADELWVDEEQVLDQDARAEDDFNKKKKKKKAADSKAEDSPKAVKRKATLEDDERTPKKAKKEKSSEGGAVKKPKKEKDSEAAKESAERKKKLKEEKAAARTEAEKIEAVSAKMSKTAVTNVTSKKVAIDGQSKVRFDVENWQWLQS